MSREAHVRFWERAVVKFRRATRLIVFNEDHFRRILSKYASYYNEVRTHLSLGKDAPCTRPIERLTLSRSRSLAGYTIDMHESEFSEAKGRRRRTIRRLGVGRIILDPDGQYWSRTATEPRHGLRQHQAS
jgi:hypothetical protein